MTDVSSSQSSCSSQEPASQTKFVIPKKTKSQFALVDLNEDDSIEKEIIEETLKKSNFDQSNRVNAYERTESKRIENKLLEDDFARLLNQKKTQIYEENRKFYNLKNQNKNKLIERPLFYVVKNEDEMKDIAKNGFVCKPSDEDDYNVLGPAQYGLHMSKHLDITLMYQYYLKIKSFYVIVVKTFYSNFRLSVPVPESNKNSYPDPNDGFEMSNQLPDKNQPIKVRYYNSLIYLFDADDNQDITEKPRNILPWVVLKFEQNLNIEKEFINLYINPNSKDLKYQMKLKKQQSKQKQSQTHQQQKLNAIQNKKDTTKPNNDYLLPSVILPPQIMPPIKANAVLNGPTTNQPFAQPSINDPVLDIISNIRNKSDNEIVPVIKPILPIFKKPDLKKTNKKITVFGSASSSSESESELSSDDEDWAEFCYKYYMENYNDFVEELHVKPPRWRIIYERTGRFDIKFKGSKRLEVKLDDVKKSKLKFIENSRVNLKDPTNRLILTYHLKRMKNSVSSTNLAVKLEPKEPRKEILNPQETKKIDRQKAMRDLDLKLEELKKKEEAVSKKNKIEKTDTIDQKKFKQSVLSSEMTSLEKRLLTKSTLGKDPPKSTINETKKSGFWEPDADSAFYLTRIRKEKCEPFEDVLILTRVNYAKKITIEYSKNYYDSNISLFESEVEKFKRLNSGLIPTEDNLVKPNIESQVKVPLKSHVEPQTRREKFMNKQKYVYHIKTNNLFTQFQVDNLNKFSTLKNRVEIHAGGFNGLVIDSERRKNCRVFDPVADLETDESQASKKITLSEYRVKPIKSEPIEPVVKAEPLSQPETIVAPVAPILPAPPSPVANSNSLPVIKIENSQYPSLSLIDEVKKRVQQSRPKSPDEIIVKKRIKNKKKFKSKKKKIKKILNSSTNSSMESSTDSEESDSESDLKHKKVKIEQEDGELEDNSSQESERYRKKHKHKNKRTRSRSKDLELDSEIDNNPTYDDYGFTESNLKSEFNEVFSEVPSPGIVNETIEDKIESDDLSLPIETMSNVSAPTETTTPSKNTMPNILSNDPLQRYYEIMKIGNNNTPPNNLLRFNKFQTPNNQKPKQPTFSSAPSFRFNKNNSATNNTPNQTGFKMGQNYPGQNPPINNNFAFNNNNINNNYDAFNNRYNNKNSLGTVVNFTNVQPGFKITQSNNNEQINTVNNFNNGSGYAFNESFNNNSNSIINNNTRFSNNKIKTGVNFQNYGQNLSGFKMNQNFTEKSQGFNGISINGNNGFGLINNYINNSATRFNAPINGRLTNQQSQPQQQQQQLQHQTRSVINTKNMPRFNPVSRLNNKNQTRDDGEDGEILD